MAEKTAELDEARDLMEAEDIDEDDPAEVILERDEGKYGSR